MIQNRCFSCMEPIQSYPCPNCGFDPGNFQSAEYTLPMGTILAGKYLVGRVLGQGGFGITYIGWDMALERKVAIKEFYPSGQVSRAPGDTSLTWYSTEAAQQAQQNGMGMFLKEARKMSKVDNIPGVVRVQDLFQENATAYIIMDFVEGVTLKARLQKAGPLAWDQAKGIFLPAIRTMEQVHQAGLIHRDLSPDNLMLTPEGGVRVLDLGAAKDLSINSGLSSMQVAKSGFSPWEQYLQQGGSGPWTDVYAMAATIYYTLTGKLPPNAVDRANQDTISWVEPGLQALPASTLHALQKAMAVQSSERIRSMEELGQGLFDEKKAAPAPKAADVTPKAPQKQEKGKSKARRWLIPVSAALVLCLGVAVLLSGKPSNSASPAQSTSHKTSQTQSNVAALPSNFDDDAAYLAQMKTWTEHESALDRAGSMCTYWDGEGQERCRIYTDQEGKRQFVVTAEYNSDGKLVQECCYDGAGSLKWAEQSTWSPKGFLLSEKLVDGGGQCIEESESTQNAQGRIRSTVRKNGEGTILETASYEYKDDGTTVQSIVYGDGKKSISTLDKEERLLSSEYYNADGSCDYRYENVYNGGEKPIKSMTYTPDGALKTETHYEYDGERCIRRTFFRNGAEDLTVENVYNAYGELLYSCDTFKSGSSDTTVYFQSISGKFIRQHQFGSPDLDYSRDYISQFDESGRQILSEGYDQSGKLCSTTNYEYDVFGNMKSYTAVDYLDDTYTVTQYKDFNDPISKVTYDYDDVKTGWTEYTYSKNSRTDKTYDQTGALVGVVENQYDDSGNQLQRKVYDESGRLYFEYIYTYEKGVQTGITSTYYSSYDGTKEVTEYDGNWNKLSEKTYDANGNLISSK